MDIKPMKCAACGAPYSGTVQCDYCRSYFSPVHQVKQETFSRDILASMSLQEYQKNRVAIHNQLVGKPGAVIEFTDWKTWWT